MIGMVLAAGEGPAAAAADRRAAQDAAAGGRRAHDPRRRAGQPRRGRARARRRGHRLRRRARGGARAGARAPPRRCRSSTVFNDKAEEWNNAYSLWCAREHFAEGVLLSNGDTVHPPSVEEDAARGARGPELVIAVDDHKPLGEEEMKVHLSDDGRLERINKGARPGDRARRVHRRHADRAGRGGRRWPTRWRPPGGATRSSTTRTASRSSPTAAATSASRRSARSSGSRSTTTPTSPGRGRSRAAPDPHDRRAAGRRHRPGHRGAARAAAGRPAASRPAATSPWSSGRGWASEIADGRCARAWTTPSSCRSRTGRRGRRAGAGGASCAPASTTPSWASAAGARSTWPSTPRRSNGLPMVVGGHEPRPRRARLAGGLAGWRAGARAPTACRCRSPSSSTSTTCAAPSPDLRRGGHRRRALQPVGDRGLAAGRARPRRGRSTASP